MKILNAQLAHCSYPLYIDDGLLKDKALLCRHIRAEQVMIVTNSRVAEHYLPALQQAFSDIQCDVVVLPDGEQYKTLDTLTKIFDALLEHQHHRHTTLLALGGGVIGDMTGFAAACYQRGVAYVQIPTTLLAQVDASIGGKTAVNHRLGKNMIGAFYQPHAVIIDSSTLATLDARNYSAGIAEIIKHALIKDADFFEWLQQSMPALMTQDKTVLAEAVYRACDIKLQFVQADEKEQTGERALLNLGHTFGHAIEQQAGYGRWLHGEAVAIGLVLSAELSQRLGWLRTDEVARIRQLLQSAHLPVTLPDDIAPQQLMDSMAMDKKNVANTPTFVLLKSIGSATLCSTVDQAVLHEVMNGQ